MTGRASAVPVRGVLAVTAAAEASLLAFGARTGGWAALGLMLIASAGWAFAAWDERIEAHPRAVMAAIALALLVAVAMPPRQSRDVWSYTAYGRIVSVHHTSPYTHRPNEFPHDVLFPRVGAGWASAPSVYGPLFTAGSAVLTRLAQDSALRARLAFQGLAALAAALALALVWRATRSARALAFLGLHPVLVLEVVNNGHNDALVGLAVLAAALFASRRRWNAAGLVLGLGLLVKASTGLGVLGLAAWALQRDRRGAIRLVAVAAAVTLLGYLPAGTPAVRAVTHAGRGNTRASLWDVVSLVLHAPTALALACALALAVVAASIYSSRTRPERAAVATTTAYLVAGAYVLPAYTMWALPSAALQRSSKLSALVGIQAAFLVAVYQFEPAAHPTLFGIAAVTRTGLVQLGAWAAFVIFVALLVRARSRSPSRALT